MAPHEPLSPVASHLVTVRAPQTPIYRVARGIDPFEPPPWQLARPDDGTFGNRFDDPRGRYGRPVEERFRVLYCATQRAGAFGETLAHFRPSLALLAGLAEVDDDEPLPPSRQVVIPQDWRERRRLGITTLDPALRFVDLAASQTIHHLRTALASTTRALGLEDFDISTVTGPHRLLTQEVARYVYEQIDEAGRPRFAGLRYLSRLNLDWECWAIFDRRLRHQPRIPQLIQPDDPGLIVAAELFDLNIETFAGDTLW